jgi:hypothetical protein
MLKITALDSKRITGYTEEAEAKARFLRNSIPSIKFSLEDSEQIDLAKFERFLIGLQIEAVRLNEVLVNIQNVVSKEGKNINVIK